MNSVYLNQLLIVVLLLESYISLLPVSTVNRPKQDRYIVGINVINKK